MKRYIKGTYMRLQSNATLRALMEQKGFSLARLSRYAGCSRSFIGHLRSGHKKTCTPALAQRIAEALDVPLELLFMPSLSSDAGQKINRRETAA